MLDLLIRGGTVVDGTGAPGYRADVGVAAGRIVTVGGGVPHVAARTLDAAGLVVCPGFVDMHAHCDLNVLTDPAQHHAVAQGVTCEVLGQDGLSYAPVDDTIANDLHARVRGWHGPAPADGAGWSSVAGYLRRVDGSTAVNTCYLAPHGTLRMLVLGTDARRPTGAELRAMCELLDTALSDGAVGLSTGLTYAPAMYATAEELVALCRVVARHGGFFAPHHRNYGAHAIEAYAECVDLARASGAALHLTHAHLGYPVNRGRAAELLGMVDDALAEGLDVTLDSYPYLAGATYLHAFLPGWVQEGTVDDTLDRLSDPAVRDRLRADVEVRGCDGSHGVPVDWHTVVVSAVSEPRNRSHAGLSIAEIAGRRGRDPFDVYLDLLISERLGATCLHHVGNEDNVREIMRHPTHMAGSDGLLTGARPHPRAYGTFARYLGLYSREERVVPLEEMVRKMTTAPARRLRLPDRGQVGPGMAADLVCFDPVLVRDRATYSDPRRSPDGVPYVVVNGEVVIEEGRHTGALPGRALRPGREGPPDKARDGE